MLKDKNFGSLSHKVRLELMSIIDDYYSLEKQLTVVVMPFFGLLQTQGNECKTFLNFVDINTLDLMNRQFKDVFVYPGENRYLSQYGESLKCVEHLMQEQNTFSRVVNKTTNFNDTLKVHKNILSLYEKTVNNFDLISKKYPLPYKTVLNIKTPQDLICFINKLNKEIKQNNCKNKICLICPISFITEHKASVYNSLVETINSIGGTLYFAQNQSDKYLYSGMSKMLFDEQYSEKFVHSIQDFAKVYNENVIKLAKRKLKFESLIKKVKNGELGTSEIEIMDNLKKIDTNEIFLHKHLDDKNLSK